MAILDPEIPLVTRIAPVSDPRCRLIGPLPRQPLYDLCSSTGINLWRAYDNRR